LRSKEQSGHPFRVIAANVPVASEETSRTFLGGDQGGASGDGTAWLPLRPGWRLGPHPGNDPGCCGDEAEEPLRPSRQRPRLRSRERTSHPWAAIAADVSVASEETRRPAWGRPRRCVGLRDRVATVVAAVQTLGTGSERSSGDCGAAPRDDSEHRRVAKVAIAGANQAPLPLPSQHTFR
jgi:hypothetical protein